MAFKTRMLLLLAWLVTAAFSLECRKTENGIIEFFEGEIAVVPDPFDCLRITKPDETTVHVTYLKDDDEGHNVCQINKDGIPKDKRVYVRSEVVTGMKCRYVCKDSEDLYKCDSVTHPADNACTCHPAPPRLLIHPIQDSISGQGDDESEEEGCEGRPEGYQFDDPVSCSSMQGDITKMRINYINEDLDRCSAVVSTKKETRYTQASTTDLNLQGCFYVCKKAGPRCVGEIEDEKCDCQSPGLVKMLVPMDSLAVRDVLSQTKCTPGSCGPCADCNEETGDCERIPGAHEGDRCECGEICPSRDLRAPEYRGGKILCRPNLALDCMKKPGWLRSMFDYAEPGTRYPTLCTAGRVDATDTCSCADGYMEQPGPFSGMYCVKRR